jgi:transcriptional regulator with XRE-family HTH domain
MIMVVKKGANPLEDQEIYGKCLGISLKRRREEFGLTQAYVSAEADIAEKTLSMIERGERVPGSFTLSQIRKAMGISLDRLDHDVRTCMEEYKKRTRKF